MPKRTDCEAEAEKTVADNNYKRGWNAEKASKRGGDYTWAQNIVEDVLENTRSDVLRSKLKQ